MFEMTESQFNVLADLLRSRGLARNAVKLVMVKQQTPGAAAKAVGMSPQAVSNALRRYRKAHGKLLEVYC